MSIVSEIGRLRKGLHNRLFMQKVRWRMKSAARQYPLGTILDTPALKCDPDSPLSVWLLTGKRDALMALWAIKSLLWQSRPKRWDVWIDSDGRMDAETQELFEKHLPGVHVLCSAEMERDVYERLAHFPASRDLRSRYVYARKIFDAFLLFPKERFLMIDSDILFFNHPTELIDRLCDPNDNKHYFCRQPGSRSTFTEEEERRLIGQPVVQDFNSGLGIISRSSIDLELIERAITTTEAPKNFPFVLEQSLYALLSTRQGVDFLSSRYQVSMGRTLPPSQAVCTHYVSIERDRFYSEGLRHLISQNFLKQLK